MRRLPTLSKKHKVHLINHLLFLKGSTKMTNTKHQLDIQVISETKSLKIETSKCERRSGDYWRYCMNHMIKLIALTNLGAEF